MEITTELIETTYKRANQYAITKYGSEPAYIRIEEDGFRAVWYGHYRDDDDDEEFFTVDCLTEDLDKVAAQRKIDLEEESKRYKKKQEQDRIEREKREKENRKAQYLKLKKEFE